MASMRAASPSANIRCAGPRTQERSCKPKSLINTLLRNIAKFSCTRVARKLPNRARIWPEMDFSSDRWVCKTLKIGCPSSDSCLRKPLLYPSELQALWPIL